MRSNAAYSPCGLPSDLAVRHILTFAVIAAGILPLAGHGMLPQLTTATVLSCLDSSLIQIDIQVIIFESALC